MYENCKRRLAIYNATPIEQYEKRKELLVDLLGQVGEESYIEPPFYCDYGKQIMVGAHFYANYGCVMVDTAPIIIGDHVLLGPGVHIYCANHPLDHMQRRTGQEIMSEVVIGDDVWIGGHTTINPGVHIGKRSVIGSGSVVTHDIPSDVVACGNPCRVIRSLR